MRTRGTKCKSHFALKVKLKSLYLSHAHLDNALTLTVCVFYEDEEEGKVSCAAERIHIADVLNRHSDYTCKVRINKSFYLPIVCLRGECPEFVNITCNIEDGEERGLKLFLNKNYSFLKYYSLYKTYKLYKRDSCYVNDHLELALDIVSCERPFSYFAKNGEEMVQEGYYSLATNVSISRLKREISIYKNDRDTYLHIDSFRINGTNGVNDTSMSDKKGKSAPKNVAAEGNTLLRIFASSSKEAYEKMPIPLIPSSNLVHFLFSEVLPQYTQNSETPNWLRVFNDIYDMFLCKHFQVHSAEKIYVTKDTDVIRDSLIGILIFGDDKTDTDNAYKKYNNEIKAQQWVNKGIAKIKVENVKELKKDQKMNLNNMKVPLSLLSFNLSTLVAYKGFKMYVIPAPFLPLNVTRLENVRGNLKQELKLLENMIPTYNLLNQGWGKNIFLSQYHTMGYYVFYNVNSMVVRSSKRNFALFGNFKQEHCDSEARGQSKMEKFFPGMSLCMPILSVNKNIHLYYEEVERSDERVCDFDKYVEVYLEKVVRDVENLFFSVPFDSISLKMYLHSRGIKMKYLGRMIKYVTFRWLYNMLYNEILIRCIKRYVFHCIREICIFYKKRVHHYLSRYAEKWGYKEKTIGKIFTFVNNARGENEKGEVTSVDVASADLSTSPQSEKTDDSEKLEEYFSGSGNSSDYTPCQFSSSHFSPSECEARMQRHKQKENSYSRKRALKSFISMRCINLKISLDNKSILSSCIFFTLMYHHHLNISNDANGSRWLYNKGVITTVEDGNKGGRSKERILRRNAERRKQAKWFNKKRENNEKQMDCVDGWRVNFLMASQENITLYSDSTYLTLYSLLNIVTTGIKLNILECSLKVSSYLFRYISEDSVASVHVRIMWLSIYVLGKYYQRKRGKMEESSKKFFLHAPSGIERSYVGEEVLHLGEEYPLIIDRNSTGCGDGNNTDCNDDSCLLRNENYCESSSHLERKEDLFSQFGNVDVYKKTHQICFTILNNYFVCFHPMYLDLYLALSWYNKSRKHYEEFLHLLRMALLLQINMSLKNSPEQVMESVKMGDDFDHILYREKSNYLQKMNKREDETVLRDSVINVPSHFVYDICYPHDKLFLCENIKVVPKCSSFYNPRLGCTLHYFANSLFYYYNNNKIIKKYKSTDFVLNSSYYCIQVLENVKNIFQSFGKKNEYVANVCLDISLMTLKVFFSGVHSIHKSWMMAYALVHAKQAAMTFRWMYGMNNINTLYSKYVLGLIYMHLENRKCMYIFEEICSYIINYSYTYEDKNIVNRILWFLPDYILHSKCVNGKGILNRETIESYLFYTWFNIFIPIKYVKKIMNTLILLYASDAIKKSGKKKKQSFFKSTIHLYDMHFHTFDEVILYIKAYTHILRKKELLSQMHEFHGKLRKLRILGNDNCGMTGEENGSGDDLAEAYYGTSDADLIGLSGKLSSEVGIGIGSLGERSDQEDILARLEKKANTLLQSEHYEEGRREESITEGYLKGLIKTVEGKAKLLYEAEGCLSDDGKGHFPQDMKKSRPSSTLKKRVESEKGRNVDDNENGGRRSGRRSGDETDLAASRTTDRNDWSDESPGSFRLTDKSTSGGVNCKNGRKHKRSKHALVKYAVTFKETRRELTRDNHVQIFMSLLYHFVNYNTYEQFFVQMKQE
ncbi:hypothetical protein POVWA1_078010 [Plasmodium ovale wallikeri]|uniref:CLU central domain-containing protein n=1 Tax=Plasmodium ovale wallikeri TaxID=864142 RepID=A0A1A9AJB7_PLAOA|nr:hypothetical protein POVWA1_078010 [Plasmodium ovale wallikeri]